MIKFLFFEVFDLCSFFLLKSYIFELILIILFNDYIYKNFNYNLLANFGPKVNSKKTIFSVLFKINEFL